MDPLENILALAQQALERFDDTDARLSSIAQTTLRIARLRHDHVAVWWLSREVAGADDSAARGRLSAELAPYFSEEQRQKIKDWVVESFIEERSIRPAEPEGTLAAEEKVYGSSIADLEESIASFQGLADTTDPTESREAQRVHDWAKLSSMQLRSILGRIRNRVHEYLSQAEEQLMYGQFISDIFEESRRYVDQALETRVPETASQLRAAYKRLREGDSEARTHAVTSCRRALKSLADVLYPPRAAPVRGPDGKEHGLTESEYVNRLRQFVYESVGQHRARQLLLAQIETLGARIEALNNLTSKGVHAEIESHETNQCFIQTYLAVGDILRLDDETSAVSAANDAEPDDVRMDG